MSKTMVLLRDDLTADQARRALLVLDAMGLAAEAHQETVSAQTPGALEGDATQTASTDDAVPTKVVPMATAASRWKLSVAAEEIDRARQLVDDLLAGKDALVWRARRAVLIGVAPAGIWTARNSAAALAIAAVCVTVHIAVHAGGPTSRSDMVAAGAVAPWLVRDGEWWRLLSAVFLHFDVKHLVGNMSALLFLGAPLAFQIGQWRTVVLFVTSGVAGNIVSQILGDEAAVKAGASGGVCGLLGALAGVALVVMASADDAAERRPAWQTLGALVALFGMMVGFEPGRDHYAHVGALVAGVVLGRMFALRAREAAV